MMLDQGGVTRQPASTLHSAWQTRRPASRSCGQRPDTRACRLHLQCLKRSGGLKRSAQSVGAHFYTALHGNGCATVAYHRSLR